MGGNPPPHVNLRRQGDPLQGKAWRKEHINMGKQEISILQKTPMMVKKSKRFGEASLASRTAVRLQHNKSENRYFSRPPTCRGDESDRSCERTELWGKGRAPPNCTPIARAMMCCN